MFPAVAPAMTREMKRSGRMRASVASAKITIDAALPARDTKMTGRRPYLSLSLPRTGVARSCVNEKTDRMNPTTCAVPPIDFT
jgi:hypothetical protein